MENDAPSSEKERTFTAVKECKFCRDPIHKRARICKVCGQPQGVLRRGGRFISATLSSLVALGSLGIAYLQYADATAARIAERREKLAAVEAIDDIVGALDDHGREQLTENLSPTLDRDVPALERRLRATPDDVDARRDLLLRRAIAPLPRPNR